MVIPRAAPAIRKAYNLRLSIGMTPQNNRDMNDSALLFISVVSGPARSPGTVPEEGGQRVPTDRDYLDRRSCSRHARKSISPLTSFSHYSSFASISVPCRPLNLE